MYMLHSDIKQGLPWSPYLFLFYIDDIFNYFDGIFVNPRSDIFENLHILIHADDANIISSSRDLMIRKLKSLLRYCHINSIIFQPSKCYFTVINGSTDEKSLVKISDHNSVDYKDHLEILGSHISGSIKIDLE